MEFLDVIRNRESIREYDPAKKVDRTVLEKILEAGRIAPSAANRQPWRLVVVTSPEMLAKMRQCYGRPWFQDVPHILVVIGTKSAAWVRPTDGYNSLETDLAIATDHMILAAENEGLATCWIAAFDPGILRPALQLTDDEYVYAISPLGYPKEGFRKKGAKQRKKPEEVVQFL
jgi:nitroreductase